MKFSSVRFVLLAAMTLASRLSALAEPVSAPPRAEAYRFANVVIGGGGFVTGIVFHPSERDLVYLRTDVGGAYRWEARTAQWTPLLDWVGQSDRNLSGIESLACDPQDPQRVYLAAGTYLNARAPNGELLRSADRGATWQRAPLPFKLGGNETGRNNGERLVVDPHDGRVLFLGTRNAGLWRSADRGATWAQVTTFPAYDEALTEPVNPGFFGPQPVGINLVFFDPRSGHPGEPTPVVYAAVSTPRASLFKSTDGGATWAAVAGQPTGLRPTRAALSSTGILYLSYGKESGPNVMTDGAVWRLDTASGVWADITPKRPGAGLAFGYGAVAVDLHHPDTVLAGTWHHEYPVDLIYRSTDGGRTWTELLARAEWDHSPAPYTRKMPHHWLADIEIDPFDSDHAIFPTGYGIWVTRDLRAADAGRPTRWKFENQGIEESVPLTLVSPPRGAHLLSGLGDIDGFRHDDVTVSPPAGRFGTPAFKNTASLAFAGAHPEILVRSGNTYRNDLVTAGYSTDGGTTWRALAGEPPGTAGSRMRGSGPITLSADGKTVVWSPMGVAPHLTEDWGATWRPCTGGRVGLAVVADPVNSEIFYAYNAVDGTLLVSHDRARSFAVAASGLPTLKAGGWGPPPGKLITVPEHEGELWAIASDLFGGGGGVLLHSPDGGRSVRTLPNVSATQVGFGHAAPGQSRPAVFIVGKVSGVEGIFRSDDYGVTWSRISDADHGYGTISALTGDPRIYGRVYFGTFGRGIVYGDRVN